jgi:hypothetical protein
MGQQNLDFGSSAVGDGETDATAFLKIQENFAELYGSAGAISHAISTVISAATCDIGAASTDRVSITGSTGPITSFGTSTNKLRFVTFASTPTLTHNATSLILPNGASRTAAAGDSAIFASDGSGNWRCLAYQDAAGLGDPTTFTTLTSVDDEADFTPIYDTSAATWKKALTKNLGFTQAGTGATLRTLQSKLRETVSVTDFGAVGDGSTDDTAAIQAAVTAGHAVYFPKPSSYYKVTSAITVSGARKLYGDSKIASRVVGTHSGRIFSFEDVGTYGLRICDLSIEGNGSSVGLYIASTAEETAHIALEAVRIYNHDKGVDGVDTYGVFDSAWHKVDFLSCATWGINLSGSQNCFTACTWRLCGRGVSIDNQSGNASIGGGAFIGCTWIGNTFDFVVNSATVRPISCVGCWFEQTVTLTVGNTEAGEVNFLSMGFHNCLFQPSATATVDGVMSAFTYKGTVSFDACVVYTDLYASASIPNESSEDGNSYVRRHDCISIDGSAVVTKLANSYQPLDSDLTSIAALTTAAYGRGLLEYASEATFKAGVNLEANTDFYAPGGTDVAVTDGGTGDSGTAWDTSHTPTITASSGTLTTTSATFRFKKLGRTVWFTAQITLTNIGTGTGFLRMTLPHTLAAHVFEFVGRESATTGKVVLAHGASGGTLVNIADYANASIITNGHVIGISGCYEASA